MPRWSFRHFREADKHRLAALSATCTCRQSTITTLADPPLRCASRPRHAQVDSKPRHQAVFCAEMRLAAYAGASALLAVGVILRAFHERPNFYSASVYLAQSNACRMVSNPQPL